ncbi:MAG TPA: hypothetical protein DCE56_06585 [Cyanobacteria bacterium UBA8553]|nr:hypothetical protein [Cyanobacteria bacterium UBA8553]HAJ59297.1 hypothetical protein [Cyanobacteria bacterium UBA8543]
MGNKFNTKNRYSGFALMPQSVSKDWWLIVRIVAKPSGDNKVYHVRQVVGFDNALKEYRQIIEEESDRNDSLNDAKLQFIVQQQI